MIWVGLDLHKRYITACALDDVGAVVAEHRRLSTEAEALVAWLQELGGPVTVAMEATLYWAWLHDRLSEAGIAAVAAHPYQVKLRRAHEAATARGLLARWERRYPDGVVGQFAFAQCSLCANPVVVGGGTNVEFPLHPSRSCHPGGRRAARVLGRDGPGPPGPRPVPFSC